MEKKGIQAKNRHLSSLDDSDLSLVSNQEPYTMKWYICCMEFKEDIHFPKYKGNMPIRKLASKKGLPAYLGGQNMNTEELSTERTALPNPKDEFEEGLGLGRNHKKSLARKIKKFRREDHPLVKNQKRWEKKMQIDEVRTRSLKTMI